MEEWWQLSHLYVTVLLFYFPIYLVNPAITDVTVDALCGGTEECSLAIYLTGVQQAVIGLGSVVMMPMIGKLSDAYGRKNLMTIPIILQIIPIAILAWNRTRNFYYAYYVLRMLTDMVVDGGVICLALSYLADSVEEKKRVAAFSVLSGVMCGANVSANFAAGLLSIPHIFQVATAVSILAALYVRFILNDTARLKDESERLIEAESSQGSSSHTKTDFIHQIPSPKTVLLLLKSSTTFALAASVCFFNSLSESGAASFLMYYLKARFHFRKDQFALLFLVTNLGATFTNIVLMPLLGPLIGEETLLCFGLFNGFLNMLLQSIAWSTWVPYVASSLAMFFTLGSPCIRSIVSKQVSANEQGISQGCLLAITSLAGIVSPLIFSPLSALFLSERAPFHFPGFCMLCVGFSYLIGLILSIMIKVNSFISKNSEQQRRLATPYLD